MDSPDPSQVSLPQSPPPPPISRLQLQGSFAPPHSVPGHEKPAFETAVTVPVCVPSTGLSSAQPSLPLALVSASQKRLPSGDTTSMRVNAALPAPPQLSTMKVSTTKSPALGPLAGWLQLVLSTTRVFGTQPPQPAPSL